VEKCPSYREARSPYRRVGNVRSRLRGCAHGKKRRAAVYNCHAVIINVICVCVHLMGIKPVDSGLWVGERRLDVGRATLCECQDWIRCCLGWHLWKIISPTSTTTVGVVDRESWRPSEGRRSRRRLRGLDSVRGRSLTIRIGLRCRR